MVETISDLARAALALQRGAAAAAAEILLDLLAEGNDPPLAKIRDLLEQAAAAGHDDSKLVAAMMMLKGEGGPIAATPAVMLLEELVSQAQNERIRAQAHALLGDSHARGLGTEADEAAAFHHYEQAAEGGVPQCAFNVALAYDEGVFGKEADISNALAYYAKAAAAGHAQSMANIVLLYMSGRAKLPLSDDVRSLLDVPLPTNDPAAAALIHSARATLIQWAEDVPISA